MTLDPLLFAFALFALLVIGLVLGWFAWGRSLAGVTAQAQQLGEALAAAGVRAGQADALEAERDGVRADLADAREQLARLAAQQAERERGFADQLRQLEGMKAELTRLFEASAGQALTRSQESFFQLANEKFTDHQSQAAQQLSGLIGPVTEQLRRAEAKIDELEKARVDAYSGLREQIAGMREGQEAVRAEALKLSTALRSASKLRGSWGEQQLRNVLEMAGLSPYADFRTEVSVNADDGRLRPDAIIRMPGGRQLVIDAKTSLAAFQAAVEAVDDGQRQAQLAAHAKSLKLHATQLGSRRYHEQFAETPDFVVMFVPGEHFLSAAMETDPELWEAAYAQKVLIATPINLIALAKTVAQLWRQEKMADTAREIAALSKELYRRMAAMGGHLEKVGKSLDATVRTYNSYVGSLESSVMPQARKFTELNVEGADAALPEPSQVETAVRLPAAGRDLKLVAGGEE